MVTQLTTVAMLLMCLTCLLSAVGGEQQSTENTDALTGERRQMIVMEVRQQTEEQMTTLSAAISRLEDENAALKQNNMAMKQDIGSLTQDNVGVQQDIITLKHDNIALTQDNAALKYDNVALKQDIVAFKQQIQHMLSDPRHDDVAIQVAFSVVSHSAFGPVSENTIIPYEIMYVNAGLCWNSEANIFQAVLPGVYMFTASMRVHGSGNADCDIVLSHASGGQTTVASMYGRGGSYGSDANSGILELEQGDVVYVQLRSSSAGQIHSSSTQVLSTFSGFLLFE